MTPANGRRDRLVCENVDKVKRVACSIRQAVLPRDELIAVGNLALVEAAGHWNPAVNHGPFWPWAYVRVRGAMFDAVRKWTHYDRRRRAAPDTDLGLELFDLVTPTQLATPDHLEAVCLVDALRRAPLSEARLVMLYLFAGYAMSEDAAREGVTTSRISQRCREARVAIRVYLDP